MTQEVLVNNRWEDACQYIRGGATKRTKGGKGKGKKKEVQVVKESDCKSDAVGKSSAVPVNLVRWFEGHHFRHHFIAIVLLSK